MTDDAVRDLLQRAVPASGGVDFDTLAPRLAGRPRRVIAHPAGWVTAAVVLAAMIAVVAVAVAVTTGRTSDSTPSARVADSASVAALVVHDGDRVTAAGQVVALTGRAPLLCPDVPVALPGGVPLGPCALGVVAHGLDIRRLADRQVVAGGVTGFASVDGVWRRGQITVTTQRASRPRVSDPPEPAPCSTPPGGWPRSDRNDVDAIEQYAHAHPGSIVLPALLHPSPHHVVAYALTTGDPAPVERALRRTYGAGLCVRRTRYTVAQLHAVDAAAVALMKREHLVYSAGQPLGRDGQPYEEVSTVRVTAALVNFVAREPAGLVSVEPWLTPLHR